MLKSSFSYDSGNDNAGFQMLVAIAWGWTSNSDDWSVRNGNSSNLQQVENHYGRNLETKIGYGILMHDWNGLLTPNAGFNLGRDRDWTSHFGNQISSNRNFSLELGGGAAPCPMKVKPNTVPT